MPELWEHERLQLTRTDKTATEEPSTARAGAEKTAERRGRVARRNESIRRRHSPSTRLLALLGGIAVALLTSGCISIQLLGGGDEAELLETVVRGKSGPKILLLEIDGVIDGSVSRDSLLGLSEYSMVARVREVLDRARADQEVRAVLLRIDSPGGTATASEQIYTEILRFREARGIPVMAQFLSTATSGGYYIAMAADTIQAHPTSVTGSIGVLFTSVSFAGLMEKIGVEDQTVTAGVYKDAGSPYRRLNAVERAQFQAIVDDLHARFREIVGRGRPGLTAEQIASLANGRIFSASQALDAGLVDRVGTLEESVVALEGRLGTDRSRVVSYHRPRDIRRNLYTKNAGAPSFGLSGSSAAGDATLSAEVWALRQLGRILGRPGFHYLWWPGASTSLIRP